MNLLIVTLIGFFAFGCASEPTASAPAIEQNKLDAKPVKKEKAISTKEVKKTTESVEASANKNPSKKPEEPTVEKAVEKIQPKPVKKEIQQAEPKPKPKVTTKPKPKPTVKKPAPIIKPVEKAKLFFPDTLHDYGFINEGDTIKHTFRFINNGKVDLEILDVQVSCGCTIPVYSLEPIGPGRLSKIDITFLSQGKIGSQLATIDVLTNASNPRQTLYLKGVIR